VTGGRQPPPVPTERGVYHMPGDRDYDRVHMDEGFGERRFRSEEQAVASGWRHAGVR
jgi:hypothetical protein